ncbi:MAG: hypothetical protein K6B40_08710 [Firmicutes bacterium]|nr:hypothetical protein [Bacillota bacterium]
MRILSGHSKKKAVTLLLAAALLLTAAAGGTLAFLSVHTETITNTFTPAAVDCAIDETVANGIKSSVRIQNTGDIDAYIRVAAVGNTVDESGNVTGEFDLSPYLAAAAWVEGSDGYYYYPVQIAPNGFTTELLKQSIPLEGVMVTILSEAIQANGMPGVTTAQGAFAYAAAHGSGGGN